MGLASTVALGLYRSRALARALFGGGQPPLTGGDRYFDATTIALKRVIASRVERGASVLEIGCGSCAILARWMARERGLEVTCTEIDRATFDRARSCVQSEGLEIEVVHGSLFADLSGPFDWVVINPPYVPTSVGKRRGLSDEHRHQWDGGSDGARLLASFFAAASEPRGPAQLLVGVNAQHVSDELFRAVLAETPGLECVARHQSRGWPSAVYELRGSGV